MQNTKYKHPRTPLELTKLIDRCTEYLRTSYSDDAFIKEVFQLARICYTEELTLTELPKPQLTGWKLWIMRRLCA